MSGLLAHTWAGAVVCDFLINGRVAGETGINAAVVGHWDVPVGLVTGASDLAPEVRELENAVFVQTKETLGKSAAVCLVPDKSLELISEGAAEAVRRFRKGSLKAVKPSLPVTMRVDCWRREMAEKAAKTPGVRRVGELGVECAAPTVLEAITIMWDAMGRAQLEEAGWLK
jgi:D-amino peptidase